MNILISIEDLRTGGAQVFAMRLAQSLHERGHQVYLYNHYSTFINQNLAKQLSPDVPILSYEADILGLDWFMRKVQGGFRRFGRHFRFREFLIQRHLRKILENLDIDILNSHTIKSDYVSAGAATTARPRVPLVITMHGCYEDFLHKENEPKVVQLSQQALNEAVGVVYLTEKNLEIFSVPATRPLSEIIHAQIYNGFEGKFSDELPLRSQIGAGETDIVFGMVARGIAEKGWVYAVKSFLELSIIFPQSHLILVGSSDYLNELQIEYNHPRIHFVGFVPNPIDWVGLFDVGLLPSYFPSESLPNSIAEYLFCGVPVIASRIGEVPQMLMVPEHGLAGILVEQNGLGLTDPSTLTMAMRSYLTNYSQLIAHKKLARQCFDKFKMDRCIAAYEAIYEDCIAALTERE